MLKGHETYPIRYLQFKYPDHLSKRSRVKKGKEVENNAKLRSYEEIKSETKNQINAEK